MKSLIFIVIAILPFITGCRPLSKEATESYALLNKFAARQKQENNLEICGIGASIPDKVRGLDLNLSSHTKPNVEQARRLYVTVAEELLRDINNASTLRPYLHHIPFTIEDLDLGIDFLDDNYRFVEPPYVAYVSSSKGKIYYCTADPSTYTLNDDDYEEPYQSALDLVRCTE